MPEGMPTVADAFNAAGYETAWFGKWHIDGWQGRDGVRPAFHMVPRSRRGGFKQWIGYENNLAPFDCWVHGHDRSGEEITPERLDDYETDSLTDRFIEYLREQARDQSAESLDGSHASPPFFAALSVTPPHNPFIAPERWMGRHTPAGVHLRANVPPDPAVREQARRELAGYHAMIENLDYNFGRVRSALDRLGLSERTLLLFFSDHGDMMGSHGHFRKTSVYHESLNIPFLLGGAVPDAYSGKPVRTQVLEAPLNHVDIAVTTLGLCGIAPPPAMEGYDYAPHILEGSRPTGAPPDSAYLQYCRPAHYPNCIDRPWRGVVTADGWKYACFEGQPWVLFNRNVDPYELSNLACHRKSLDRRRDLGDRLADWIERTGDRFVLPESS